MSVSSKDTPAGAVAAKAAPAPTVPATKARRPFLSEGVRIDLEMHGKAGDPATGGVFVKDSKTGKVTFTDRAGKTTEL